MRVRAKFRVTTVSKYEGSVPDGVDEKGRQKSKPGIVATVEARPVYGNGDPSHENSKFWAASPGGEFKLNCVVPGLVEHLQPGVEFYLDITTAEPAQ